VMEKLSEQRGMPVGFLESHGIHRVDDHYVIPVPHANGYWYETTYHPGGKPKYRNPKGEQAHLYNPMGLGPQSDEVWIAEGQFDALSLVYLGIPAVGILGVGNFNKAWSRLFLGARIVLALDPDDAGMSAMDRLGEVFPKAEVFIVPEPHKDLNDWLVADPEGMNLAVQTY
jgi:replicative DNA helicase